MGLVVAIIIIVLLAAAFTIQYIPKAKIAAKYNKIQPNMTFDEVESILGQGMLTGNRSGLATVTWKCPIYFKKWRVGKTRVIRVVFRNDIVLESEIMTQETLEIDN